MRFQKGHIPTHGFKKGQKFSKEHKERLSKAHLGKPSPMKNKHYSEEVKKRMSLAHKGKKQSPETITKRIKKGSQHYKWKEKVAHCMGYIYLHCPNHPFRNSQGYVFEHRIVMEKHLKRYLKPEEVVHHINNTPNDNRIENLKLFSNNYKHLQFHRFSL